MIDFIQRVQAALPEAEFANWVWDAGDTLRRALGEDHWGIQAAENIRFSAELGKRDTYSTFDTVSVDVDAQNGLSWQDHLADKAQCVRPGGNLWLFAIGVPVIDAIRTVQELGNWGMIVAEERGDNSCLCALGLSRGLALPAVSVVVPTVQSAYLPRFFATHRTLQQGRVEYVVVSNGTEPLDLAQMITIRPDVFVHFQEPLGFPRACNVGASLTRPESEVLVLANDDTEMTLFGWDNRIWEIADGERDMGAVAPVLSSIGNRWQLHGAMPVPDLYEAPVLFYAWVAFPRAVWKEVGGLSEAFGMGNCEDIDHSLRIRLSGRRLLVDPVTAVYHRVHGTFDLMTPAQFNSVLANAAAVLRATWGDQLAELAPDVDQWTRRMTREPDLSVDTSV